MSGLTLALIAYILIQLGVAIWASRRIGTDADYLVAGRRLGVWTLGVSLFATWFGGETVMGASAAIAGQGLAGARAEPVGYALCLAASALLVAGALRAKGYMTLADFFRDRFGARAEVAAALVSIPTSVIWAAAQLIALSALMSAVTDLPVTTTLIAAGALVIAYTLLGGLLGDVITDVLQSLVVLAGLIILFVLLIGRAGGVEAALSGIRPDQLVLVPYGESWIERVDAFAIPILGSIVAQEMIARFLGAKTAKTAVHGGLMAGGLYLVVGVFPLAFGLIGASAGFDPGAGDLYLPLMAAELLPSALFVVFIGALFSAVLSTVDSALLAVSGLAAENLYARVRRNADAGEKLIAARADRHRRARRVGRGVLRRDDLRPCGAGERAGVGRPSGLAHDRAAYPVRRGVERPGRAGRRAGDDLAGRLGARHLRRLPAVHRGRGAGLWAGRFRAASA